MNKRNTLAGRVGLLAVALFVLGCEESVTPAPPRFWVGGEPAALVFTGQPNSAAVAPGCAAASGTAIAVEVTVVDATGKTITDFTGLVKLAINDDASPGGNATLCGNTEVDVVDGVARFSGLGVDQPGEGYTLVAIAEGAESAVSDPFNITRSTTAGQLVFTGQPNNAFVAPGCAAASGSAVSVEVTVVDADGKPVTDFPGSVTLTIANDASAAANATLCGTTTADIVDGVARFTDLGIDQPGVGYKLKATTQGATRGISALFDITTTQPAPTGDLRVETVTTGPAPSGYTVTVTGGGSLPIGPTDAVTFKGLTPGSHSVELVVPGTCTVTGDNPRDVDVPSGSATTTKFEVSCGTPTGDLRVETATTGSGPSGYTVTVTGGGSLPIGPTDAVTFRGLAPGSHRVELLGVGTCTVTGDNPRDVDVPSGSATTTRFVVSCPLPPGDLRVETATTGSGPSGYTVTVTGGGSLPIGPTDAVTFRGLAPGSHRVELLGVGTCTVTGDNPRDVNVPSGSATTTRFVVTCPQPRLVFTGQPNDAVANVNLVGQCVFAANDPSLPTTVSAAVTATQNGGTPVAGASVSITVVHVSGTTGTVCPGSTLTAVTGSDGVAHFNLSIGQGLTDPPGTYSLTATATVQGMTLTVGSNTFTVSVIT
jgi:uncharacterized protein GlcG (DUF336 family)